AHECNHVGDRPGRQGGIAVFDRRVAGRRDAARGTEDQSSFDVLIDRIDDLNVRAEEGADTGRRADDGQDRGDGLGFGTGDGHDRGAVRERATRCETSAGEVDSRVSEDHVVRTSERGADTAAQRVVLELYDGEKIAGDDRDRWAQRDGSESGLRGKRTSFGDDRKHAGLFAEDLDLEACRAAFRRWHVAPDQRGGRQVALAIGRVSKIHERLRARPRKGSLELWWNPADDDGLGEHASGDESTYHAGKSETHRYSPREVRSVSLPSFFTSAFSVSARFERACALCGCAGWLGVLHEVRTSALAA